MAEVKILPGAARYFKKITDKKLKALFKSKIEEIATNPYAGSAKKGDLSGIYSCDVYYNKTNYELAYRLMKNDKGEVVVVIMAGTRENFYDQLKKYIKAR